MVVGENCGQGSSREHATIAPRYLGLRVVIAKSFARIHWQNLVSFGILPLTCADSAHHDIIKQGDVIVIEDVHHQLEQCDQLEAAIEGADRKLDVKHGLSRRQQDILKAGSPVTWMRRARKSAESAVERW